MKKLLAILGLVTVFDHIDGEFKPQLTGAVINFNGGKGIGAFLGQEGEIGPLTMWRVWQRRANAFTFSIYTLASTDVSSASETGLWSNGTFGLEPRVHWTEFGNAEIGVGILTARFVEGEKAQWTPYFKLAFRPL
jgi:hypothetical protein